MPYEIEWTRRDGRKAPETGIPTEHEALIIVITYAADRMRVYYWEDDSTVVLRTDPVNARAVIRKVSDGLGSIVGLEAAAVAFDPKSASPDMYDQLEFAALQYAAARLEAVNDPAAAAALRAMKPV